jgi:hypothetical protein
MKKKSILALVALGMLSTSSVAWADWSGEDQVREIRQSRSSYDNGRTVIKLKNTPCSTGDFYIADSSSNKDLKVRLLTAALLSGRDVNLGHTANSSGCDVYSVVLK